MKLNLAMNIPDQSQKTAQLTDAFRLFNELSQNLAESYQGLEEQVAKLSRELAAARNERLKTLIEKEKLANRFEVILAALPAGVIILNDAQQVIDCNALAVELLGEPLLGRLWSDLVRVLLKVKPDNPHEGQLASGKRVTITRSALDEHGGQLVLLTDVSEMRSLQDSLNRQKQLSAMGEMVASMAHQVRTPLATAILYASQMSKPSLTDAKKHSFAGKILERLQHLDRQVNDMLIFAKDGRLKMAEFSLSELIVQLHESMLGLIADKHVQFELIQQTHSDSLQGNQNALQGALLNLLNNAVEAVSEHGLVKMRVTEQDGVVKIYIKDDGCGIPAEQVQRIFEPFFTTKLNGTGLGLSVVDNVIKAHGGELKCVSEPGRGTEFTVSLPSSAQAFKPLLSNFSAKLQQVMEEINHASV